MDTLCVPVKPPELQTLALNNMRMPYERAKFVLVLDSHLRSLQSHQLSPLEILAHVSCSSWVRRLWTLQEGRLAQRVWFQFADKAVNVENLYVTMNRTMTPSRLESRMINDLYVQLLMHLGYKHEIRNTSAVAGALSSNNHALMSRSVSVPTDEALCLFNLMNFDLKTITAVQPLQRMELFWRMFAMVPKGLLFSKAPRKMSPKGLHWAPSTFMGFQTEKEWNGPQELSSPAENEPHAIPIESGLQLALPGFVFHSRLIECMRSFDFNGDSIS